MKPKYTLGAKIALGIVFGCNAALFIAFLVWVCLEVV